MKSKNVAIALTISLISILPNQSAVAQMAEAVQKMRAAGVPIVLPTYLPPGFRGTDFRISSDRWNSYHATFEGPNNCEISVGGLDGGWGAPPSVRSWEVNTPLFGKIILEEVWEGNQEPNSLLSGATPTSEKGVIPGFPRAGYIFNFNCTNSVFSPQQASQILKSMQVIQ